MSAGPLYLHIGLQKTGTSYLQRIFWQNTRELARQGLDLVPGSKRESFHLRLRVRNQYRPEIDPPGVASALDRLPEQLAAAPGDRALITEESLAPSLSDQIGRLLDACGDREVHLVLTLRDLGRQIPSAWQETIQAGSPRSYDEYLTRMRETEGNALNNVWGSKDVAAILERWSAFVPAERIHLVTVPPDGGDPELLLHRFCEVLGVDHTTLRRAVAAQNPGIGYVQAELLRRVNVRLAPEDRRREVYGLIGKDWFAAKVLGPQKGASTRIPAEHADWIRGLAKRYSDAIRIGGYHVVGDLADLDPTPSAFEAVGHDAVTPEQVSDAAVDALAAVLASRIVELRVRRSTPVEPPRPASWWARLRRR